MKKSFWTVIFMVIITIVFIAALSSVNELTREKIMQNSLIENYKSILYAFDIFPLGQGEAGYPLKATTADIPWTPNDILKSFKTQIYKVSVPVTSEQKKLLASSYLVIADSAEIFVRVQNDSIIAFGFPMRGKGLWGTITAFGVASSDLKRMIGIDFIEQVETPGLGARILEIEFKRFFRGLDLSGFAASSPERPAIVMVNRKEKSNLEQTTNELQAITGATQTCNGVLKMVNTDVEFYLQVLETNRELIAQKLNSL